MKRVLWVIISLVFWVGKTECYGKEQEPGELYATAAVLMDGDSGRLLYEKNGQEFMANASTTKILTCILALEKANLKDVVTVSNYAESMPDVQLHIREGEQYQLEDLLYSLMLESHNDAAVAVAEHVSGSCENFSKLMNQKAREIGCENTFFLTPNGLDAGIFETGKFHGTTAEDLALMMRYCTQVSPQRDVFIKITSAPFYDFTDKEKTRSFHCRNHNSLFNLMEGVISGKTGFTGRAGYCYVGAVKQQGKTYIVALLACGWPGNKSYKWKDCKTLIDYGMKEYRYVDLEQVKKEQEQKISFYVKGAKRERVEDKIWIKPMKEETAFKSVLLKSDESITIKITEYELRAPIEKGQEIGEYLIFINEKLWNKEKLYSDNEIEKMDFRCCFKMIVNKII